MATRKMSKTTKTEPVEPESVEPVEPKPMVHHRSICVVAGCDRAAVWHGLCGAHYASRRGDGR